MKKIALGLVSIVLVGLIWLLAMKFQDPLPKFKPSVFYAVFLTNDQVYFGKIAEQSRTMLALKNAYYLKANAEMINADDPEETSSATAKLSLVKLGEELHAPKDMLVINKEHVLFWEEMEPKGVIMNAILDYEQRHRGQ